MKQFKPCWLSLFSIVLLLGGCANFDINVKVEKPAPPASAGSVSPLNEIKISGTEQLNFVLKPLTTICHPMNFTVAYGKDTEAAIRDALAKVGGPGSDAKRTFTVSIADFNARVMSLVVEAFSLRHDTEVRLELQANVNSQNQPERIVIGKADHYVKPDKTTTSCEDAQEGLATALRAAATDAIAELVKSIEAGNYVPNARPAQSGSPSS